MTPRRLLEWLYDVFERWSAVRMLVGICGTIVVIALSWTGSYQWQVWADRHYVKEHQIATPEEALTLIKSAKISPEAAHAMATQAHAASINDETAKLVHHCFFIVGHRYFIPYDQFPYPFDALRSTPSYAREWGFYVDMQTGHVTQAKDLTLRFPFVNALYYKDLK
jgi:hypothetical protein